MSSSTRSPGRCPGSVTVDYISSTPKQTATGQCSKCGAFVVIDVLGDEKPTITTLQSCPRCTPDEYLTMSIATLEKQKADTLNKLSGISMQKAVPWPGVPPQIILDK
jgi:ribosomal protein S27AE